MPAYRIHRFAYRVHSIRLDLRVKTLWNLYLIDIQVIRSKRSMMQSRDDGKAMVLLKRHYAYYPAKG